MSITPTANRQGEVYFSPPQITELNGLVRASKVSIVAKVAFAAFVIGIFVSWIALSPLAALGITIGCAIGACISYSVILATKHEETTLTSSLTDRLSKLELPS